MGLSTALLLQHNGIPVTVFESDHRLGGHSLTVERKDLPSIDVGFQVYNLTICTNLVGLCKFLGLADDCRKLVSAESNGFENALALIDSVYAESSFAVNWMALKVYVESR